MEREEVMVIVPSIDFNFDSNFTAPSTPQRFGNYFFRPPTPTISSSQPINNNNNNDNDDEDFEFNFSGHLQRPSLSADELFHGGKILPLKLIPPPTTHKSSSLPTSSEEEEVNKAQQENKLVRERASSFSIPSCRKGSEKPSFRISDSNRYSSVTESDDVFSTSNKKLKTSASTFTSFLSSISFSKGYRKWRFKDFLLFRSASEGRATDRDPLRKYAVLSKTTAYEDVGNSSAVLSKTTAYEDVSNSSFRSTENSGSVSKRRKPVSAHELHYTMNRAASEELKRKTMLPYKQGLLGCLGFNHGMHQISGRFGSLERS